MTREAIPVCRACEAEWYRGHVCDYRALDAKNKVFDAAMSLFTIEARADRLRVDEVPELEKRREALFLACFEYTRMINEGR